MLLVPPTGPLSTVTKSELTRLGPVNARVVGGVGAVSSGVVSELTGRGLAVSRHGGEDRYGTAALVAGQIPTGAIGSFRSLRTAIVATGADFPDALSAGPLASGGAGPILFTAPARTAAEAFLTANRSTIATITVVGGTAAVPTAAVTALKSAATLPSNQTIAVTPAGPRR